MKPESFVMKATAKAKDLHFAVSNLIENDQDVLFIVPKTFDSLNEVTFYTILYRAAIFSPKAKDETPR